MANLKTLRFGDISPQVELLQLALQRAGLYSGAIDGIFGNGTLTAVKEFQSRNRIISDGIVGIKTWRALRPYLTGYVSYIVKNGDTFYNLAIRFSSSIRAIAAANPNVDYFSLSPGQRLIIPLGFDVVPTNIRFTSTVLDFCIEGLIARYPFIRYSSFGRSVMGKELCSFSMGVGNKEIFYNASHHANEWITTPVLLKFLESYAYAYSTGRSIFGYSAFELYNSATLYIAPMVNPDGVDLVTEELDDGPFYTQTKNISEKYPDIPFPSGWKANIRGTDLNLQYPAGWENAREIKFSQGFSSPAPRDYVGSSPLSSPESRAVYDFTLLHNFSLTLSYHTQGKVIFWKYLDFEPAQSREIAVRFSDVSGYALEDTPVSSGYAGYKDWFISNYDRPGYTIEAGIGVSPLSISQFDEIYKDNLGILTLGLTFPE